MTGLVVAAVIAPLSAAAVTALGRRSRVLQRSLSVGTVLGVLVIGLRLLLEPGTPPVVTLGGWPPAVAIVLVADPFAAVLLTATGTLGAAVLVYAAAGADDHHPFFHPLVLVLVAAAAGSYLTGDLFNLFVFLEVALVASYVLAALEGTARQVRATAVYAATNLLGSLLLLTGIGWIYGIRGTVSFALLTRAEDPLPVAVGALVLVALGVKAAFLPLGGWLPIAYPAAPRTVAALFAGLLTTIGVVAVYRVHALVLGSDPVYRPALLGAALLSLAVGALAATGRPTAERALSFVVIAQVGFMLLGPALLGVVGLAAGVFFIAQDVLVKTAAFLALGTARDEAGREPGGSVLGTRPVLVASYLIAAFSLAGIPPLSGFVGKLLLLDATLDRGYGLVVVAALAASLLVLVSVLQPWKGLFAEPREEVAVRPAGPRPARIRLGRTAPVALLAALAVAIGLRPGWLYDQALRAAEWLAEPVRYAEAVLG